MNLSKTDANNVFLYLIRWRKFWCKCSRNKTYVLRMNSVITALVYRLLLRVSYCVKCVWFCTGHFGMVSFNLTPSTLFATLLLITDIFWLQHATYIKLWITIKKSENVLTINFTLKSFDILCKTSKSIRCIGILKDLSYFYNL